MNDLRSLVEKTPGSINYWHQNLHSVKIVITIWSWISRLAILNGLHCNSWDSSIVDISGALSILKIQYEYTQTKYGARDVNSIEVQEVYKILTEYKYFQSMVQAWSLVKTLLWTQNWGYIDVGDFMLVTICGCWSRYWWHLLNVGARRLCWKIEDIGDENGQIRRQHLKVVANTFRPQHPSPTSM